MPLETKHVLNTPRFGRPPISINTIKCVLKVMLQNSTTKGFSYVIIAKEVRKHRHEIAPRTVWKVLKQVSYSQCKLIVKPRLNKFNKKQRLDWCLKREN
jgi:hypothetical protein